ncbi:MAG: PadR family transcriptional regulator [Mollicutes bacterium]|nr:PadR family transcriptional regulator [Mollicutes bacterium]
MNTQFKKGVLELIVLVSVYKKDMYGYELIEEVSKVVDVNDGTIYPLLKRLTLEKYFETYLVESNEGPSRKYYRITDLGKKRMKELMDIWVSFASSVNKFIEESEKSE